MNTTFTIEHDGATFDFAALPPASQRALAREGLVHIRGNRVASKVVGYFRQQAAKDYNAAHGEGAFGKLDAATASRLAKEAIPDSESDAYQAKVREFRAETDKAILEGTLGDGRVAGPKMSPLEAEMEAIAKRELLVILVEKGIFTPSAKRRVPKPGDVFELKDGDRTYESFLAGYQAKHAERLEREAKAEIAKREKAAAKVAGQDLDF